MLLLIEHHMKEGTNRFTVSPTDVGPNVEYVEMNIPAVFPLLWRRFIPNVFYGSHYHCTEDDRWVLIDARWGGDLLSMCAIAHRICLKSDTEKKKSNPCTETILGIGS